MTSTGLSDHARARLREELELLRSQRHAVFDGLDDLDTAGDRMDNAETIRRRDEVARIDDRIAELTRVLAGGFHPNPDAPGYDVAPGTQVTLRYEDGSVETLRAVAMTEEIAPGEEDTVLTLHSPLGRAIAGHQAGDTVSFQAPAGRQQVEIVKLEAPA